MKKGTLGRIIGTLGLIGLSILPNKKANCIEDIVNGNIITTTTEENVKSGVKVSAWEFLGLDRNSYTIWMDESGNEIKEYNEIIGDKVGEGITDSNGEFNLNLNDNSSSHLKLEINDPDSSYYSAVRYVDLRNGRINLDIIPKHMVDVYGDPTAPPDYIGHRDFMEFFNIWARGMNGCTQRWANEDEGGNGLKVFIKTPLAAPSQIDSVYSKIQNLWPRLTQRVGKEPLIQNIYIEQGEVIPDYAKYGTDGWTLVKWRDSGDPAHTEKLIGNRIYSAAAILTPYRGNDAITEELLQILGLRTEVPDLYPWDADGNILNSCYEIFKTLCSRPIGNKTPDINPWPQVSIIRYIRPVTNLSVEDVPDDNGHQLLLNFTPSVSEGKGIVSNYRIYRSENTNFSNAALIDSVAAGSTSFVDRNVPLNNQVYYYWIETVGNVANYVVEKANNSGKTRFIEAPRNFIVSDVPNDNGHQLKLDWDKSLSELDNLVDWYRIFRSRNPNGIEMVRNLSDFLSMNADSRLDSLNSWDGNYAVLVDSVLTGNTEYTDFVPLNNTPYHYWLQAVGNNAGSAKIAGKWNNVRVKEENREFKVGNAYPNPFNASTSIDYQIPEGANVNLVVYDVNGRKVRTIYCGYRDGGSYKANWDGRDSKGRIIGNGIYFYELDAGKYNKTGKLMLVK